MNLEEIRNSEWFVPALIVAAVLFAVSNPAVRDWFRNTINGTVSYFRGPAIVLQRHEPTDPAEEAFRRRMASYRLLHGHLDKEAQAKLEAQLPAIANDKEASQ